MSRMMLWAAAAMLAVPAPVMLPTAAIAAANPEVAFCKDYVSQGYDANLNVGQCVSLLTTDNNYYTKGAGGDGFATHLCQYLENNYPYVYDENGWTSLSDCIQALHSQV